jgi:predicted membrane metal-binding protein
MVCATLLPIIAIIVVAVRLYARFYITRAPGIDDLLVVFSLIFGIALSVLVMIGNQIYYNGYHVWVGWTH